MSFIYIYFIFYFLKVLIKAKKLKKATLVTLDIYFWSNYLTNGQTKKKVLYFFIIYTKMLCVGQGSKTYIFFLCKTSMKKKEIFFTLKYIECTHCHATLNNGTLLKLSYISDRIC